MDASDRASPSGPREITLRNEPVPGAREITLRGESGPRAGPREVALSDLVPGAREVTDRIEAVAGAREFTGRIELVPGAREVTLPDNLSWAAAPGARPPRDLVLNAHGVQRLLGDGKPQVPPFQNREPRWDPDDPDVLGGLPRFWVQRVVGNGKAPWSHRDGATLCTLDAPKGAKGRFLLIGGWDTSKDEEDKHKDWETDDFERWDEVDYERALTTNEVWGTDDGGETWDRRLKHQKFDTLQAAKDAKRFPRVHTPAWAYCDGYFYLIGGDVYVPHSQVWRTPLSGDGTTWEWVNDIPAPWNDRILAFAGSLNKNLYAMGGQITEDYTTASNDVFELKEGEKDWHQLHWPLWATKGLDGEWAPRGMVYGMPVIRNKVTGKDELYLIGGGIFGVAVYFDDVWRFDGTYWFRVPPKPAPGAQPGWPTGLNPPERSGRKYHNVVLTPPGPDWPDGLLWVITGSIGGNGSSKTILVSRNVGATWEIFMIADWGIGGSHADAVTVFDGDIIRATGNAYDRSTYRIHQVSIKEWLARPAPPRVDGFVDPLDPGGPLVTSLRGKKDDEVMLKGANLKSALTVRVDPTSVNVIYVDPIPPVLDDTIRVSIPEAPAGVVPGTDTDSVFIVVVGPAGSSNFANAKFIYTAT